MGKTININTYRKRRRHSGQLDYEETADIKEKYEIAAAIIDELFVRAERCILESGFNPADFNLVNEFVDDILRADLGEFFVGGEEALFLAYKATVKGIAYYVDSLANVDGENVIFDTTFVKDDGNERLAYEDGRWVPGPVAD